ncbi:MAG: DsbE family thiol:disulfide interchange protein [Sphingomonadaceae bacterium]|nr:DsbE family thiol:disulfide interchange protein [Sphingomonadaceae bacterium]
MRPSRIVAPLALTMALLLLGVRLALRPSPDPAIGRRFPHLALMPLPGTPPLTDARLRAGHATAVTLFASWCLPCRADAPALAALRARGVAVAGIAVRDAPADAAGFLAATHTRLDAGGIDARERTQVALGTAGIPETWLVDGDGVIRARVRGTLQPDDVARLAGR